MQEQRGQNKVSPYMHLNPGRAGLIRPEAALQIYRWSSSPNLRLPIFPFRTPTPTTGGSA